MEDRWLVYCCKRGSGEALRRVYEKYKRDLVVLAVALLQDGHLAEDVLHDVFVAFVAGLPEFRLTGSLKGYLATCVANRARNIRKARYRGESGLDEAAAVSDGGAGPGERIECNEELQRLAAAMSELSDEQREVIGLHAYGGMSLRAIGKHLAIPANTAKSRYRYGIDKLRSILNSEAEK